MASNYQDEDIQAAWGDVFSRDKYRIMISCIADNSSGWTTRTSTP